MNLADIRKKSEDLRKPATAAREESGRVIEESCFVATVEPAAVIEELPATVAAHLEMAQEEFSAPMAADLSGLHGFDTAAEINPAIEPPVVRDSHLSVAAPASRKAAVYNPVETILAGREAVTDDDEVTLYQASSYSSDEVEEYLCFRVADEEYAISIMAIKEIIKPRDVTEVPRMPAFISGVISLRGVIIPVMNMRLRLALPVISAALRERIVVLKRDAGFCGILVDEVIQVARIKKCDLEDPPAVLDGIDKDFVTGLGHFDNRMLILLNLEAILDIGIH